MRRAVLKCYGHVTVSPAELAGILTVENISQDAAVLAHSNSPLDALLLDYKPGATIVTVDNVTEKATEAALRSLYVIHTAHVLHGSVGPGSNILFDSINAYWINFENSQCGGDTSLDRQTLFKELEDGWDYLYACLVSPSHWVRKMYSNYPVAFRQASWDYKQGFAGQRPVKVLQYSIQCLASSLKVVRSKFLACQIRHRLSLVKPLRLDRAFPSCSSFGDTNFESVIYAIE